MSGFEPVNDIFAEDDDDLPSWEQPVNEDHPLSLVKMNVEDYNPLEDDEGEEVPIADFFQDLAPNDVEEEDEQDFSSMSLPDYQNFWSIRQPSKDAKSPLGT